MKLLILPSVELTLSNETSSSLYSPPPPVELTSSKLSENSASLSSYDSYAANASLFHKSLLSLS